MKAMGTQIIHLHPTLVGSTHFGKHNTSNIEADEQKQKTTSGFMLVNQEQESEASVGKGSSKLDS